MILKDYVHRLRSLNAKMSSRVILELNYLAFVISVY